MSMHYRAVGAAALVLALAGSASAIAAAVPASAATDPTYAEQFCKTYALLRVEAGLPENVVGGCVGYLETGGGSAGLDAYFCKYTYVPDGDFATFGQCESFFEANPGLG